MKRSMVFEGIVAILFILLVFLMFAMLSGGSTQKEISVSGDIQYTYAGSDDTLYVFSGDHISAIDGSGTQKWDFQVPGQWSVCYYGYYPWTLRSDGRPEVDTKGPIVSSGDGILYVYMIPVDPGNSGIYIDGALMAISDGRELWELPVTGHNISYPAWNYDETPYEITRLFSDTRVYASGDRVYVFHGYNETVIGENGTVLFNIGNVTDPVSVDERGFVYCINSTAPQAWEQDYPYSDYLPDYRTPSDIIDAYYPNGTLYWESRTESPLARQSGPGDSLPLYNGGMVYAPMYNGIAALYANGTVKWTKMYNGSDFKFDWPFDPNSLTASMQSDIKAYEAGFKASRPPSPRLPVANGIEVSLGLYSAMPFDTDGNVYVQCISDIPSSDSFLGQPRMFLLTIGHDGNEVSRVLQYPSTYLAAKDGIGYATESSIQELDNGPQITYSLYKPVNVTDLGSEKLIACDVKNGKELWNYTFTTKDPTIVTLDRSNVQHLIGGWVAWEALNNSTGIVPDYTDTQFMYSPYGSIMPGESLQVSPGNNVTYVSFQSMNYELPLTLGKSKAAYAGGVYALNTNGTLLWHKQTPPFNSIQVTGNGTIFFQTPDGKIGVTNAGIAAGFTLTALAYLFLRFFCLGAVARAKARINKNENRNLMYDFIVRNPGSTIYEIARGTNVNLGTVRYHIFILKLNHKIVSSRMDGKFIRHFTNSNSYSQEEQLILSLVRRGTLGRVLTIMLEKPGLSNIQISRELGITESEVSRYVNELADKGVVARTPDTKERAYAIEETKRERIISTIKRLGG